MSGGADEPRAVRERARAKPSASSAQRAQATLARPMANRLQRRWRPWAHRACQSTVRASGDTADRSTRGSDQLRSDPEAQGGEPSDLLQVIARALRLPIVATAAAILIKGHGQPGDGFSAGIACGTAVALDLVVFGRASVAERFPLERGPAFALLGLALMLLVAFAPLALGAELLRHWPGPHEPGLGLGTLALGTELAFELGMALVAFGFSLGAIDQLSASLARPGEPP